jgi:hypothetical protein
VNAGLGFRVTSAVTRDSQIVSKLIVIPHINVIKQESKIETKYLKIDAKKLTNSKLGTGNIRSIIIFTK